MCLKIANYFLYSASRRQVKLVIFFFFYTTGKFLRMHYVGYKNRNLLNLKAVARCW